MKHPVYSLSMLLPILAAAMVTGIAWGLLSIQSALAQPADGPVTCKTSSRTENPLRMSFLHYTGLSEASM